MIEKYGNKDLNPESYILPILEKEMTAREQTRAVSNFTRFLSQNLAETAKLIGVLGNLANMVARHTFATSIIRSGKPVQYPQKKQWDTKAKGQQIRILQVLRTTK